MRTTKPTKPKPKTKPEDRLPPGSGIGFTVAALSVIALPVAFFIAWSGRRRPASGEIYVPPLREPVGLKPIPSHPLPPGATMSIREGETVIVQDEHAATEASEQKPGLWAATMEVFNKFSEDDVMTQAAALAFYVGLALAPLLTVLFWIATIVLQKLHLTDDAARSITDVATSVLGAKAAAPIGDLLKPASAQAGGMTLTGTFSAIFLAFTASSVLAQLQSSLNLIWRVKADPKISGIVMMIRKRIFSFGMLFTLLFLLMVAMAASVAIEAMFSGKKQEQDVAKAVQQTTQPTTRITTATGPVTVPIVAVEGANATASTQAQASTTAAPAAVVGSPEDAKAATRAAATQVTAATQAVEDAKSKRWIFQTVNLVVSFFVATGVFMLLFTYLPDARVPWKDTLVGAMLTSGLFLVGRFAMGWYLGRGSYETSYGAAVGSFVALLVWVYYTSIIIFIGTEATQVYARRNGHEPKPEKHAVKTERIEKTITPATREA